MKKKKKREVDTIFKTNPIKCNTDIKLKRIALCFENKSAESFAWQFNAH